MARVVSLLSQQSDFAAEKEMKKSFFIVIGIILILTLSACKATDTLTVPEAVEYLATINQTNLPPNIDGRDNI